MNIFGIGGAELVLIILIMLIVAGPRRMIQWAYIFGTYMAKLRQMWVQVAEVLQAEMDSAGVEIKVPKELPNRNTLNTWVQNSANEAMKPIREPIEQTMKEVKHASQIKDNSSPNQVALGAWSGQTSTEEQVNPASNAPVKPDKISLGTWGNIISTNESDDR